jgi:hypothetical protein
MDGWITDMSDADKRAILRETASQAAQLSNPFSHYGIPP